VDGRDKPGHDEEETSVRSVRSPLLACDAAPLLPAFLRCAKFVAALFHALYQSGGGLIEDASG